MNLEDLNPEFREKAKDCTSVDELKELCRKLGVELSDEQLESISGGYPTCPHNMCYGKHTCSPVLG